jgi:precorrin-6B methylase 2
MHQSGAAGKVESFDQVYMNGLGKKLIINVLQTCLKTQNSMVINVFRGNNFQANLTKTHQVVIKFS